MPNLAQTLHLDLPFVVPSLPGDWCIDWNRFYELDPADKPAPAGSQLPATHPNLPPGGTMAFRRNFSRSLDPYLAATLHTLPGAAGSLPLLNLLRGKNLGLPSGRDVARAMTAKGVPVPVLTADEIGSSGADGATAKQLGFADQEPRSG